MNESFLFGFMVGVVFALFFFTILGIQENRRR